MSIVKAIRQRDMDEVKRLIEAGAALNEICVGWTPLNLAIYDSQFSIVKLLMDSGADVNKADNKGRTPINIAVLYERIEILKLLIEYGADVNKPDGKGRTPMHVARGTGNQETIKLLEQAMGRAHGFICIHSFR